MELKIVFCGKKSWKLICSSWGRYVMIMIDDSQPPMHATNLARKIFFGILTLIYG